MLEFFIAEHLLKLFSLYEEGALSLSFSLSDNKRQIKLYI